MDDRGDGVEEGERVAAGLGGDRLGEAGPVSGPVAMIVGLIGQGVDPLADDVDVGMGGDARA